MRGARHRSPADLTVVSPEEGDEAAHRHEKLIDDTLAVWQPLSPRPLSREDAREIRENLTGFFLLLLRWQAAAATGPATTVADVDGGERLAA